ncbi:MAG: Cof-type HAD-IIB family hydrolase [Coriobacteriales bacterium]|nr:Cof-type HAD-IIB family hydrolase [Coriobacteriales bacterium]
MTQAEPPSPDSPAPLSRLALIPVTAPEAQAWLKDITHIYTDLDGTLLAPGGRLLTSHDGTPSTATAEALVALRRAGIEVIIVTGRNGTQGHELLRILNLTTFIGELGCLVMEGFGATAHITYELGDWAEVVLAEGLAPGTLPKETTPYQLIQNSGAIDRLLAAFPGRLEPHLPYPNERMVTHALRGFVDAQAVEQLLAREQLPLRLVDNGEIHPQAHTLVNCPEIHIYHLMPSGVSKASAIATDIARRGLSPKQALAIGDAKADMEMGEHTGALVVLANALRSAAVQDTLLCRAAKGSVTLRTEAPTADGWAEFACALLAARQKAAE